MGWASRTFNRGKLGFHGRVGDAGLGFKDARGALEPRILHDVECLDRRIVHPERGNALLDGRDHLRSDLERDVPLRTDDGVHRLAHDVDDHFPVADLDHARLQRLHHDVGHFPLNGLHERDGLVDLLQFLHGDFEFSVLKTLFEAALPLFLERGFRLLADPRGLGLGGGDDLGG